MSDPVVTSNSQPPAPVPPPNPLYNKIGMAAVGGAVLLAIYHHGFGGVGQLVSYGFEAVIVASVLTTFPRLQEQGQMRLPLKEILTENAIPLITIFGSLAEVFGFFG